MDLKNHIFLAWGRKVSPRFCQKVIRICDELGWTREHANWLMACMAFETAETFSPDIRNAAGSGAIGLLQFMPATLSSMGYALGELKLMTAEEQLDVVKDYFHPYRRRIQSLSDMYMAILLPKYIGKPDTTILFSGGIAYRQNSGLDTNKDGKITKGEAAGKVMDKLRKGYGFHYAEIFEIEAQA